MEATAAYCSDAWDRGQVGHENETSKLKDMNLLDDQEHVQPTVEDNSDEIVGKVMNNVMKNFGMSSSVLASHWMEYFQESEEFEYYAPRTLERLHGHSQDIVYALRQYKEEVKDKLECLLSAIKGGEYN